eukprot:tig00001299_g8068.t1
MGVAASQLAPQLFGMTIGEGCPQELRDSGSIVVCNRTESSLILAQVLKPASPFLSLRTARLVPGRFVRFRVKKDKNAPPMPTEPGATAEKLPPSSGSYQVIASSLQDDTFSQTWFPAQGGDIYALGAAASPLGPEAAPGSEGWSEAHPPAPAPPVDPFARPTAPPAAPHQEQRPAPAPAPAAPAAAPSSGGNSSGFAASFFKQVQGRRSGERAKPQLPFQLKQKADLLGHALLNKAGQLRNRAAGHLALAAPGPRPARSARQGPRKLARS